MRRRSPRSPAPDPGKVANPNKRRLLPRAGIVILCVLCGVGALSIGLLARALPMSLSAPKRGAEQGLGEGEALVFSLMRLNPLRPFELYVLDHTGGIRSLSRGLRRSDLGAVWSPDGAQIAFQSVYGWTTRTYLVDADGARRREITPDDRFKGLLRWSPDSSHLAYLTYDQQPDGSISNSPTLCVVNVSTGDTHQAPAGNIQDLVWVPDGQSLLAVAQADEGVSIDLYGANADHQRRMYAADYLRDATSITLSPDASQVAYLSPAADEDIESMTDVLHVSALDGSTARSARVPWPEGATVWSPDSSRIAFVGFAEDAGYTLYVLNVDGMELQELMLVNTGDDSGEIVPAAPAWSPDGTRIAISSFSSPKGGAVFVMNADGTERRQIVAPAGIAIARFGGMIYDLAWRPGP